MDLHKMLLELRAEQQQVDEAILVLQRIEAGRPGKRRGRKPKWITEAASPAAATKRKVRTFTAAQRKAASARMKNRWAAKKKASKS